jgi:glutathione S-transferase
MARIGLLAAPDQRRPGMTDHKLVFHYAPRSRASTLRILLDELGANYELKVHNAKAGVLQSPEYLKINPLGKVPAVQDGETLITESIAIAL